MPRSKGRCGWILSGIVLLAHSVIAVAANLYSARDAYEKKDFARAFEEFRALAELGHPLAQETVAIMYAGGEGVARDGMQAYAWAQVARENGAGPRSQVIVDQLARFVTPEARKSIDDVQARFGKKALEERLLPAVSEPGVISDARAPFCKMSRPVNPDKYYPRSAIKNGISGSVFVVLHLLPDGGVRNPLVLRSMPIEVFDQAARRVAFESGYEAPKEAGVPVACSMAFWVSFSSHASAVSSSGMQKKLAQIKASADAGDPTAQLEYGMLKTGWRELNPDRKNYSDLFLRAAQAGLPDAQYFVGAGALHGLGFKFDRQKGVLWLQMAADAGQHEAQLALANELMRGHPDAATIARARELLEKAAAGGHADAGFYLADLLLSDPDISKRDPRGALRLLAKVQRDEDPSANELGASAHSQLGEFGDAIAAQKRAISKAKRLKWDTRPMETRLATYEGQQAYVGLLLTY